MPERDVEFCYKLVVGAAQVLGNPFASNSELMETIREFHEKAQMTMPDEGKLKKAMAEFRKAGTQFPGSFSSRKR